MFYRYEIYDEDGFVGGLFRGAAYPLNEMYDKNKTDFKKLDALLDELFDAHWLINPKLDDSTNMNFYFTEKGNERAKKFLGKIDKLLNTYGYRLVARTMESCTDTVYADSNQIAVRV